MQVKDMRMKEHVFFETIKKGEVFCWEGKLWMRIRPCKVGDTLCNTVDIADGMLVYFANPELVEKLDIELIIR